MPTPRNVAPKPDPRSPLVFDVSRLGRRPGAMQEIRQTEPSPSRIGLDLIAIEQENRLHTHLASSEARMQKLGEQLCAAEMELAQRDLTTLSTGRLLSHVENLQRRLQREAGPMRFVNAVDQIPEDDYADRIQIWNP